MDEALVKADIEAINNDLIGSLEIVKERVTQVEKYTQTLVWDFRDQTADRIGAINTSLIPYINELYAQTTHRVLRVMFHASPEIFAIIMAMVTIYRIVNFAIKVAQIIQIIGTIWRIHEIIAAVWPRYRESFNNLLNQVSQASEALGWGVDGINHLLNATVSGINIVGGLFGKNWNMMRFEMMEQSQELIQQMSRMFTALQEDPGRVISQLFENRYLLQADNVGKWWDTTSEWITEGLEKAETAFEGVSGVVGELQAIQNNMPEEVRKNIPAAIWDGLEKADSTINTYILPQIWTVVNSIQVIDNLLEQHVQRIGSLATKLANPGEILLTVDDLPEGVKASQLGMIDDVTSREFDFWANEERSEVQADLDDFERIDNLMKAPTPAPGFMGLEDPAHKRLMGITVEPHETWFVGDF